MLPGRSLRGHVCCSLNPNAIVPAASCSISHLILYNLLQSYYIIKNVHGTWYIIINLVLLSIAEWATLGSILYVCRMCVCCWLFWGHSRLQAIHLPLWLHSLCIITLHAHSYSKSPRYIITTVISYMCFVELLTSSSAKTHVHGTYWTSADPSLSCFHIHANHTTAATNLLQVVWV